MQYDVMVNYGVTVHCSAYRALLSREALPRFAQVSSTPTLKRLGLSYDQIASNDCFRRDPDQFYGFWLSSYTAYTRAAPHKGYRILNPGS